MRRVVVRRRIRRWSARLAPSSRTVRPDPPRRSKVRALIACADPDRASRIIGALEGTRVEAVGVATTSAAAARDMAALKPDVAVFDSDLGGEMRGIDAGLELRNSGSNPGLVVLCPDDDRHRLNDVPSGLGSEWSCLLTETAMQPSSQASG